MAGDAVSVAPNFYKVLLENDKVRVLETRYGPGVKCEMHSHPGLVAVALTPSKAILTLAVNAFLSWPAFFATAVGCRCSP